MTEDEEFELLERRMKRDFERVFGKQQALDKKADNARELGLNYEPNQPVAWRKNVGGTWHYFDKSSPFPIDDLEPLYLRSEK